MKRVALCGFIAGVSLVLMVYETHIGEAWPAAAWGWACGMWTANLMDAVTHWSKA